MIETYSNVNARMVRMVHVMVNWIGHYLGELSVSESFNIKLNDGSTLKMCTSGQCSSMTPYALCCWHGHIELDARNIMQTHKLKQIKF